MDPPTATARVTPQGCEVWCSTQNAEAVRTDLSKRFNVAIDKRSEERRVGKECRYRCDWSSDVCSSDLHRPSHAARLRGLVQHAECRSRPNRPVETLQRGDRQEIGRASCRERV